MKRWFDVFVFVIWSLVTASGAETFADRLAALQSRLQSDPTNALILFQLGDLCHDEGAKNDEKAVILAEVYFMYGSVLTMRARDTLWPLTQLNYVKAGRWMPQSR